MGKCRFCGRSAGIFRTQHRDCAEKHVKGKQEIARLITETAISTRPHFPISEQVKTIADGAFIAAAEGRQLYVRSWGAAVDRCLQDGVIPEREENQLIEIKDQLSISRDDLEREGSWERVVKSAVIRDLLNGVLPKRIHIDGTLNFNLQKGEQIVWAFRNVELLEDRTYRQYVGASHGFSVRVMKGVYYHVGAFQGRPIDRFERVRVDTGLMAVTNKNIYFGGAHKSLRIPYNKIVRFEPFEDGLGTVRDAVSAKPQIFVTGDGWFTYNLVTNLAHFSSV